MISLIFLYDEIGVVWQAWLRENKKAEAEVLFVSKAYRSDYMDANVNL